MFAAAVRQLFLHHPPVTVDCEWLDRIGLMEPEPLLRIIAGNPNVRFVCAGHVHHASQTTLGQTTFYTTPSTGIQFLPRGIEPAYEAIPPGYRIIEVDDGEFATDVARLPELRYPPAR